jgi:Ca2+-binding RTX toxin-like protein
MRSISASLVVVAMVSVTALPVFADTIRGTSGDDDLVGTDGDDIIRGRGGDDRLTGLGGKDRLAGQGGRDLLRGRYGRDVLRGGEQRDTLFGGSGRDRVAGGPGRDGLYGEGPGDVLLGQRGDDVVSVEWPPGKGAGKDLIKTGRGDDYVFLVFDGLADVIDCGPGEDNVEWLGSDDPHDTFTNCETFVGP